ncbi:MAG TPA: phosphotransferase family protein [Acidimicrobiia bacterium]|nr:phosphotransferase family protein [Acidimicrobiia bacterium]
MPIPEQRDLEQARATLAAWLTRQLPDATGVQVGPISGPAATGFSNETLLFDASWVTDGAPVEESLVLRVKPTQHTVFLEADFEQQYLVLRTLGEHSDVPVPPVRWYEADDRVLGAPFFVMERVEGRTPEDSPPYTVGGWLLDEATPQQRRTLVESGLEAMARVHGVDWRQLDLGVLSKPQYGRLGFEQQLRYYERSFTWAEDAAGYAAPAVPRATLEWIQRNAPAEDPEIALCWGDARINNQLFGPDYRVTAVLDWEMVTLADPMMDLGWWLFLDRHFHEGMPAPRMDGFPTRDEMVAHYERASGRAARDLDFYEIFAGLRFAVVMIRIATLVTGFGLMPIEAAEEMSANNAVTRVLADLLDLPAPGPPPEVITPAP